MRYWLFCAWRGSHRTATDWLTETTTCLRCGRTWHRDPGPL